MAFIYEYIIESAKKEVRMPFPDFDAEVVENVDS